MISLKNVDEFSKDEMLNFLKTYEEYTLFLLGNLEVYGLHLTEDLYSGNYKIACDPNGIIAVFSLTRGGSLLIHSKKISTPLFELVLCACQKEQIGLNGLIGEWEFCHRFWKFLKEKGAIQKEVHVSKEILYAADLSQLSFEKESNVRLLTSNDWEQWLPLHNEYIKEMHYPEQGGKEELCKEFQMMVAAKISWGLFFDEKLISIANLNARALDLGQVGGVYTTPKFRKQGFASAVMRQLIHDAKELHRIRKLIIFTAETNLSARRVYESLGVFPVGYCALLFGSSIHRKCEIKS